MLSHSASLVLENAVREKRLTLHSDSEGVYVAAYFEGTDKEFEALCQLTDLLKLNCDAASITDAAFTTAKSLTKLEYLAFTDTAVTGQALAVLEAMGYLQEIVCNPKENTREAARYIAECESLRSVYFPMSSFSNEDIALVTKLPYLEALSLEASTTIDDNGLKNLYRCKGLEKLCLSSCNVGDTACSDIVQCPSLKEVSIGRTHITGKGIRLLGQLPQLEELLLSRNSIGNDDIRQLGRHPNLRDLALTGTNIDDEVIPFLLDIPHLKRLDVCHTNITRKGAMRLLADRDWTMMDHDWALEVWESEEPDE